VLRWAPPVALSGGALTDVGINDKWMKDIPAAIEPGNAALFVLVRTVLETRS